MKTTPMKTTVIALAALASLAAGAESPLGKGDVSLQTGKAALQTGDIPAACAAFREAAACFGSRVLTQPPARFGKLAEAHTHPEAMAILKSGEMGYFMGSKRMAKGAYRVVIDRFPDLQAKRGGKLQPMEKQLWATYHSFCLVTGDSENEERCERVLPIREQWGPKFLHTPKTNLLCQALKDDKWEEAAALAQEIMQDAEKAGASATYASTRYNYATILFLQKKYAECIRECEAFQADGYRLLKRIDRSSVDPLACRRQLEYFVIRSHYELGAYDKCAECCGKYLAEHKDDANIAPVVYMLYVDSLLKQDAAGNLSQVLQLCHDFAEGWPMESRVAKTCRLVLDTIAGSGKVEESEAYQKLRLSQRLLMAEVCGYSRDGSRYREALEVYRALADHDLAMHSEFFHSVGAPAVERFVELCMQAGDYAALMDRRTSPAIPFGFYLYKAMVCNLPREKAVWVCRCWADAAIAAGDYHYAVEHLAMVLKQASKPTEDSAKLCAILMELYATRNRPATGSPGEAAYVPSDLWMAWFTGQCYVSRIMLSSRFVPEGTPEADAYAEVRELTEKYNTPEVQAEDAARKEHGSPAPLF